MLALTLTPEYHEQRADTMTQTSLRLNLETLALTLELNLAHKSRR